MEYKLFIDDSDVVIFCVSSESTLSAIKYIRENLEAKIITSRS